MAIFFWQENKPHGEFCQWFQCTFRLKSSEITSLIGTHIYSDNPDQQVRFKCGEQFMMFCKAARFGDAESQRQIFATDMPRKMKAIGRKVQGFDEEVWSEIKVKVVETGNYAKFTQDENLKKLLLDTGNNELIEASPFDPIWGIGYAAGTGAEKAEVMRNRQNWGQNLLGKVLMEVRRRLREEMETRT